MLRAREHRAGDRVVDDVDGCLGLAVLRRHDDLARSERQSVDEADQRLAARGECVGDVHAGRNHACAGRRARNRDERVAARHRVGPARQHLDRQLCRLRSPRSERRASRRIIAAAAAAHTSGRAFLNLITEPFDIVVTARPPCRSLVMLEVLSDDRQGKFECQIGGEPPTRHGIRELGGDRPDVHLACAPRPAGRARHSAPRTARARRRAASRGQQFDGKADVDAAEALPRQHQPRTLGERLRRASAGADATPVRLRNDVVERRGRREVPRALRSGRKRRLEAGAHGGDARRRPPPAAEPSSARPSPTARSTRRRRAERIPAHLSRERRCAGARAETPGSRRRARVHSPSHSGSSRPNRSSHAASSATIPRARSDRRWVVRRPILSWTSRPIRVSRPSWRAPPAPSSRGRSSPRRARPTASPRGRPTSNRRRGSAPVVRARSVVRPTYRRAAALSDMRPIIPSGMPLDADAAHHRLRTSSAQPRMPSNAIASPSTVVNWPDHQPKHWSVRDETIPRFVRVILS